MKFKGCSSMNVLQKDEIEGNQFSLFIFIPFIKGILVVIIVEKQVSLARYVEKNTLFYLQCKKHVIN